MPASYTIRRSVPRNTRRSKPASTPSTCFPSFSINLFMAFPLPRGDLSSNTTNIIREQETPSPFGCGYAALFDFIVAHEGIETNCGVWSLVRKLKILKRLRLFRLVVTGVGRLQPASVSCCKHGAQGVATSGVSVGQF